MMKMRTLALCAVTMTSAFALAGCEQAQDGSETVAGAGDGGLSFRSATGLPPQFGFDPRDCLASLTDEELQELYDNGELEDGFDPDAGTRKICTNNNFKPKFFQVIYFKFAEGAGPRMQARHAYFPVRGQTDDLACAIKYVKDDIEIPKPGSGPSPTDPTCKVFNSSKWGRIRRNFQNLGYGTQQRIYVIVDNDDIAFNPQTPISFTPFTAWQDPFNPGSIDPSEQMHPNYSFAGAKVMDFAGTGYRGLYLENHFKDANGDPIPPNDKGDTKFSINFNLLVCKKPNGNGTCNFSNPKATIPIVIDPDTGNGRPRRP